MSNVATNWVLNLIDQVTGPAKSITANLNVTTDSVDNLTAHIDTLEKRQSSFTRKFRNFSIGVAAFAALNYGSAQFSESMARANTMTDVSSETFAKYERQLKDVSTNAGILRKDLGEGLYNTISAGVPEDNWIKFIADSSKTAIGGQAELGTVVDATSSIIKSYGMEWDAAESIQDKMMKTVQLGQIPSLEALASAISKPGPLAAQLGIHIDELMGSMTALAGPNGDVNKVGTQMQAVFSGLLKPTSEATKMAEKMGLQFDAVAIKGAGGLVPFLDNLKGKTEAYAKQTGVSANEIYGNLFGSTEAISAIMTLNGAQAETFAKNTESISNSTGAVAAAHAKMAEEISFHTTNARNSFGNMMDHVFDRIAPVTIALVDSAAAIFDFVDHFSTSNPTIASWALGIGFVATALYGTALVFGIIQTQLAIYNTMMTVAMVKNYAFLSSLVSNISSLIGFGAAIILIALEGLGSFVVSMVTATAAQYGFNLALSLNPIGLAIIGFVALVGVIAIVITYWDEITAAVGAFTKILVKVIDFFLPGFEGAVKFVMENVGGWIDGLLGQFGKIWDWVKEFLGISGTVVDVEANANYNEPNYEDYQNALYVDKEINAKKEKYKSPFAPKTTPKGTNETSINGTGTGGNKSMVQNLTVNNHFKVDGDTDIENLMKKITSKITDQLQDGMMAIS